MTRIRDVRHDTSVSKVTPGHFMGDVAVGGKVIGVVGFDLPDTDPTDGDVAVWDAGTGAWIWVDSSTFGSPLDVQEDSVDVVNPTVGLNAGHGLDVVDEGGGVAGLAVDETELDGSLIPGVGAGSGGPGNDITPPLSIALPPWVKPTGSGVTTADPQGRITIDSGATYKAFPGLTFLEGRLHLVYRDGSAHNSAGATIKYRTSDDLGRTWSSAATLVTATGSNDVRDPSILALSSGRLLIGYVTRNPYNSLNIDTVTIYSDNRGQSWSSPYSVPHTFSGEGDGTSQAIELPDGTILLPGYGDNGGNYICVVWKSTDGGLTFPTQITVASSGSRHYAELQIRLLASGKIVGLMRSDTNEHTWRTASTDGGATWSAPTDVLTASSRPDFVEFFPGALLFFGRNNNTNFYARWAVSWDEGLTWTALQNLDGASDLFMYGAPVVLAPGYVAIAYSIENSGSDADIYLRYYYDGYGVDPLGQVRSKWIQVDEQTAPSTPPSGALAIYAKTDSLPYAKTDVGTELALSTPLSSATPVVESGTGTAGTGTSASRDDHAHPAVASGGGGFEPVAGEKHTSDGSTTTIVLENTYEPNSVIAYNLSTSVRLDVTESAPYTSVVISAAGTAANTLVFDYAASVI